MTPADRPRIDYFAMGGTIASLRSDSDEVGATPTLTADGIVETVPELAQVADVHPHQYLLKPSPEITMADLIRLVAEMRAAVDDGAQGLVVTQGTDTIEETSFVVDLLWDRPEPVVFTGSMRNPSLAGSEGGANLLGAVQIAASHEARDAGVLVTLNDEIHAARHVRKTHTSSPSTFASPGLGPIGWVSEGNAVLAFRPTRRTTIALDDANPIELPSVGLIKLGLADDCRLLEAAASLGYDAVVIEALGGGHIPATGLPAVDKLVQTIPVVLASRTGAGEVLSATYRFPGSEIDLLGRGVLRAGALDGPKARMLLIIALAAGFDRDALRNVLSAVGTTTTSISAPRN